MILTSPLPLLLAVVALLGARPAADHFIEGDLDAARARAEETGLMVLVELESADEAETAAFDAALWSDAEAVRWVEVEIIAVRVGGAESERLAALWDIEARPAIVIQEPDGLELRRLLTPVAPKQLIRSVRLAKVHRATLGAAVRALAAAPDDLPLRQDYAEVLLAARLFRGSLEELERVWESSRGVDSFREERLRVTVRLVSSMSSSYPKARNTLLRWRRRAISTLNQPPGTVELADLEIAARELGSINARLDASDQSTEMYRKLKARTDLPPEVRQQLYDRHMFQVFYNQKKFAELLEGSGGVAENVERALVMYERFRQRELDGELNEQERFNVPALRNSAMVRGSRFYEALLMTEDFERATLLADTLCERLPSSETYLTLMTAAKRSRARDELRRLGENGIALLTSAREVEKVRVVFEKNFKDD